MRDVNAQRECLLKVNIFKNNYIAAIDILFFNHISLVLDRLLLLQEMFTLSMQNCHPFSPDPVKMVKVQ